MSADRSDPATGAGSGQVRRRRLAGYAVVVHDGSVLLTQLSRQTARPGAWTLPGGGVEHGEDPRDAVIREVAEETGLDVALGPLLDVASSRHRRTDPDGLCEDYQAIRLVLAGSISPDAREPAVAEVDGTTQAAAWIPLGDVEGDRIDVVDIVRIGLEAHRAAYPDPRVHQRLAAYAVLTREPGEILLTRISARGHHPGAWTLPGGGVDHGEDPRDTVAREVREETGLLVHPGRLLDVHSVRLRGLAPDRVIEDYHGVHLILAAELDDPSALPAVVEVGGTTDAVAWIALAHIDAGEVEVLPVVGAARACLAAP